jgi:hypothetical protein
LKVLFDSGSCSGTVSTLSGVIAPGLQHGGGGDGLADAARLEDLADAPVAAHGVGRLARLAGVEGRHGRQRQHLPGGDVHQRRAGALRVAVRDGRGQHLLGVPLQVAVQRELHVAARLGLGDRGEAVRDDPSAAVDLRRALALTAGQHLVEAGLDPRRPLALDRGEADDVGRQLAAGSDPARLGDGADPDQAERAHLRRLVRLEAAGEVGEALAAEQLGLGAGRAGRLGAERQLRLEHVGRQVEDRGERGSDAGRLARGARLRAAPRLCDRAGLAVDGTGVHRQREHLAVPVADRPARRSQLHRGQPLLDGL